MILTTNEEYQEALKEYETVKDSFQNTPEYERMKELVDAIEEWEDKAWKDIDVLGTNLFRDELGFI